MSINLFTCAPMDKGSIAQAFGVIEPAAFTEPVHQMYWCTSHGHTMILSRRHVEHTWHSQFGL